MTPWSHLSRQLTPEEWTQLKAWLSQNPDSRSHLGDPRADGRYFHAYGRTAKAGERWITRAALDMVYERTRCSNQRYWSDPAKREAMLAEAKTRYATDPDYRTRQKGYKRRWRERNPDKMLAKTMRRNANKINLVHPELDRDIERTIYLLAAEKTAQTGQTHHVDHIIPLISGGWHHHDNLQVLPAPVNVEKGTNAYWTHPGYLSWHDVPVALWPTGLAPIYSGMAVGS